MPGTGRRTAPLAGKRRWTGMEGRPNDSVFRDCWWAPHGRERLPKKAEPGSGTFTFRRMKTGWRIDPTLLPMASGRWWRRWMGPGCPAAWFSRWTAVRRARPVGPQGAACTFAAWSPDGKWMYFSSSAGGAFHTWRQRFPRDAPEQITFGPGRRRRDRDGCGRPLFRYGRGPEAEIGFSAYGGR